MGKPAFTRRLFLQRSAVAAAAVPAAGPLLQEQILNGQRSVTAGALLHPRNQDSPYDDEESPVSKLARKTWGKSFRLAEQRFETKMAYRIGPFDADIAALRSPSLAHKVAMQRRRDTAELSILDEFRRKLGWLDDYRF